MTGMDRWIDWEKAFTGKAAALPERDGNGPAQRLVTLEIEADGAARDRRRISANIRNSAITSTSST